MIFTTMNSLFNKTKNRRAGFSLVGMLVVIVIVGIVFWYFFSSGGSGGSYNPPSKDKIQKDLQRARRGATKQEKATLKQALKRYRVNYGKYPETLNKLSEKGYVPNSALTDANGHPYDYNPETGRIN